MAKPAVCAVAALVALGACATAPQPDAKAVEAELMAVDRAFAARADKDGLKAAFSEYMDAVDGRVFTPSGQMVVGRAALEDHYGKVAPASLLSWEPQFAEAAKSGEFGYTWGLWAWRADRASKTPDSTGKYVTIWRRDAQGRWRGVIDLGVTDAEPPKPSQ